MTTERIPQEVIEAARRRLKRRVAAMIIRAMADEDCSFEVIAERLGDDPLRLRLFVHELIEGRGNSLNEVSDLCLAMGVEPQFSITRLSPQAPDEAGPSA